MLSSSESKTCAIGTLAMKPYCPSNFGLLHYGTTGISAEFTLTGQTPTELLESEDLHRVTFDEGDPKILQDKRNQAISDYRDAGETLMANPNIAPSTPPMVSEDVQNKLEDIPWTVTIDDEGDYRLLVTRDSDYDVFSESASPPSISEINLSKLIREGQETEVIEFVRRVHASGLQIDQFGNVLEGLNAHNTPPSELGTPEFVFDDTTTQERIGPALGLVIHSADIPPEELSRRALRLKHGKMIHGVRVSPIDQLNHLADCPVSSVEQKWNKGRGILETYVDHLNMPDEIPDPRADLNNKIGDVLLYPGQYDPKKIQEKIRRFKQQTESADQSLLFLNNVLSGKHVGTAIDDDPDLSQKLNELKIVLGLQEWQQDHLRQSISSTTKTTRNPISETGLTNISDNDKLVEPKSNFNTALQDVLPSGPERQQVLDILGLREIQTSKQGGQALVDENGGPTPVYDAALLTIISAPITKSQGNIGKLQFVEVTDRDDTEMTTVVAQQLKIKRLEQKANGEENQSTLENQLSEISKLLKKHNIPRDAFSRLKPNTSSGVTRGDTTPISLGLADLVAPSLDVKSTLFRAIAEDLLKNKYGLALTEVWEKVDQMRYE